MSFAKSGSVFAAVARHFENPRVVEATRLTVVRDDAARVLLTPLQARNALYGPDRDDALVTPVWQAVVQTAASEQGPDDTWRLLLVWLASPRLTGTVVRICRRLRADRDDVEAEMVLALLEGLQSDEHPSAESLDGLLKSARSRAWGLARAGAREFADDTLERLSDHHGTPPDQPQVCEQARSRRVEVTRHEHSDGLRAHLRFSISPDSVGRRALAMLSDLAEQKGAVCQKRATDRAHRFTDGSHICGTRRR
ncbi:hypothetical protein ACFU5N_28820 [Streptomyces albidoflavus]